VGDLAVIGNRSLTGRRGGTGRRRRRRRRKSGRSDVRAGSSVTASRVIVERECRDYKTSSSSHLSKVETVLSKCLSEIICRRRRIPAGRLRTQSVLVELSDINPQVIDPSIPRMLAGWTIPGRRPAEVSPLGCSPERTLSQPTFLSALRAIPFLRAKADRGPLSAGIVHHESVTTELPLPTGRRRACKEMI